MAKLKADAAERRLLEAWEPPPEAGELVGCLATTYTFDPLFFEQHCLSRFLRLETDPREDGATYLIEREDKLAQTTVVLLVDRSMAEGSESPRWGVLSVRIPDGIQHAKVTILGWYNLIRVIVGSANLTEDGYRKNQEIFGVLDFHEGAGIGIDVLDSILDFVQALAALAPGSAAEPGPQARLRELVTGLRAQARRWTLEARRGEWPQAVPVLLGPMEPLLTSIPERLGRLIRDRGGPAHSACVLSPFFDESSERPYLPTQALVAALTERGDRTLELLLPTELLPDGKQKFRAPRSITRTTRSTEVHVYPVRDEADGESRPLHAKSIWLWNDRVHAYMIGSSNFTNRGLGLDGRRNAEANLVYVVPDDEGALVRALESTLPACGERVEDLDGVLWEPLDEERGEGSTGEAPLPLGFLEALFDVVDGNGAILLRFGSGLPPRWVITGKNGSPAVYASDQWVGDGSPDSVDLPWPGPSIPSSLDVRWWDAAGIAHVATWPVNVRDLRHLPPPDELRNLSLDTLIEILGSRLPLHEAVARARRRVGGENGETVDQIPVEIDPHRRVRTETFLLQRTRRVAKAIERLVENLNRPVVHADALDWRLRGPVGPTALARALVDAARTPGEAAFLLADVALALRRVDVAKVAVGVSAEAVSGAINDVLVEVEGLARRYLADDRTPKRMADYVEKALAEARR